MAAEAGRAVARGGWLGPRLGERPQGAAASVLGRGVPAVVGCVWGEVWGVCGAALPAAASPAGFSARS